MILVCVCVQAHLVAAFEQSLANMTIRLKSLTMTADQKVKRCTCLILFVKPGNAAPKKMTKFINAIRIFT